MSKPKTRAEAEQDVRFYEFAAAEAKGNWHRLNEKLKLATAALRRFPA